MIFQDQTTFGGPGSPIEERGNCYSACVASILGLPLENVPNFCAIDDDWFVKANEWLHENCGVVVLSFSGEDPLVNHQQEYGESVVYIATGRSPRGDWHHSVLWKNGCVLHDPHPSRAGIVGRPIEWDIFVVTNIDILRSIGS